MTIERKATKLGWNLNFAEITVDSVPAAGNSIPTTEVSFWCFGASGLSGHRKKNFEKGTLRLNMFWLIIWFKKNILKKINYFNRSICCKGTLKKANLSLQINARRNSLGLTMRCHSQKFPNISGTKMLCTSNTFCRAVLYKLCRGWGQLKFVTQLATTF